MTRVEGGRVPFGGETRSSCYRRLCMSTVATYLVTNPPIHFIIHCYLETEACTHIQLNLVYLLL